VINEVTAVAVGYHVSEKIAEKAQEVEPEPKQKTVVAALPEVDRLPFENYLKKHSAPELTLAQAVERTLKKNASLSVKQARVEEDRQDRDRLLTELFPQIRGKVGYMRVDENLAQRSFETIPLEQEADTWLEGIKARDSRALKLLKSSSELYHGLLMFSHNSKKYFPCGAGMGLTGISSAGDVYLCHRFVGMDAYKLGNIFDKRIDRDAYLKRPIDFVQECSRCPARHYCAGSCRYDNAASTGSVFKPPEEMCRLHCREFELSAYLISRLDEADRAFLQEENIVPPKPCPLDFG